MVDRTNDSGGPGMRLEPGEQAPLRVPFGPQWEEGPERLPVSIYMVWQRWEKYYQSRHGRRDRVELDWLDETWIGRQRFLFEHFGDLGIGDCDPSLDRSFLSKVMPFHTMIVAVALGVEVTIQDVGGYA